MLTETSPPTAEHPSGIAKTITYTDGTEDFGWRTVPKGLKRSESPGVGTRWFAYDAAGDLRKRTDPSGLVTELSYDGLGRPTSQTVTWSSGSATTTSTYDQIGNLLQVTEPAVTNTAVTPNVVNRRRTTLTYDDNANRTTMTVADIGGSATPTPTRQTVYDFDNLDRVWRLTDAEGGVTSRTFDANGNVTSVTDPEGRVFESTYDAANRLTEVRLAGFVDDPITGSTPRDIVLARYTYDAAGRRITEAEPEPGTGGRLGQDAPGVMHQRWTSYDKADRVRTITQKSFDNRPGVSPATRDIVLEQRSYDDAGNLTNVITGDGERQVTNTYDEAGMLQAATLELGASDRVTEFDYDELANLTRHALRASGASTPTAEMRFDYDNAGRLLSETVENGATDLETTYAYDERGLRLGEVDPRGNLAGATAANFTTEFSYDLAGRLTAITAPPVEVEENGGMPSVHRPTQTFGYDAVGNEVSSVDARGHLTATSYDRLDRRTRIDHPTYTPPGGVPVLAFEAYTYDRVGNLTSARDRRGHVTDYSFDARNRVVRQLDPLVAGQTARGAIAYEYDDADNRTAQVDQTGARTELTHDDLGRVRTESAIVSQHTPASIFTTTFDHDDLGNPTYTDDPAGVTLSRVFNTASELTEVTDELGKTSSYDYDPAGRLISQQDPLGRAQVFAYDLAGRRTSTQYRAGGPTGTLLATEYAGYDAAGNLAATRSARSSSATDNTYKKTYSYDAQDRLTQVTEPVDGTTSFTSSYGYDAAGNLTRVTDGRGNATTYTFNTWNLPQSVVEPPTPGQELAVDRTFTTSYDGGGLPVGETVPGVPVPIVGGTPISITRLFDELGRLASETGTGTGVSTATRSFGYDLAGRRTSWSHPGGTILASYDDRGLLVESTAPGASTVASSFGYDAAGRMAERTDAAGTASFTYTSRGELDTIADPITGKTLDYSYNDAGQVTGVDSGISTARTYTYNSRGWPASDTVADGSTVLHEAEYDYDAEGNLVGQDITAPGNPAVGGHTYTYDRAGRLASWIKPAAGGTVSYAYDGAGNRVQAGATTYTYDARNRLTGAGTDTYTWTARGTLSSVQRGLMTATVEHDALGRLTAYGAVAYAYDALDRVATRGAQSFTYAGEEIDPVGRGAHTYGRSPTGELISWTDGTTAALVGRNRHGDLAWLASGAGALTDSRIYDPYGAVAGAAGTAAPGLGFQADYTDPASAMVWMGARWYDPATAGFASRDSVFGQLRTPFTLNRYTYAQGDPLEFFDPDGRFAVFAFGAGSCLNAAWDATGGKAVTFINTKVVQPTIRTVSSAARAVSSAVATVARTARRASTVAIQRISTTTKAFATKLVSQATDTAQAISSAAGKLKRGLAAAGSAVGRCFNGLQATCTQIALDVAVGAAVGALCINTAGLGCAIAAGAAGGAVTGAAACAAGENLGRCALQGALLGGASGGLVSKAFPALRATRAGQWFSRKVSGAGDTLRGGFRRLAIGERGSIRFGGPRSLPALRQAYVDDVASVADEVAAWQKAGADPEFIAREAWANRRAIGIQYKDLTPADKLAEITARNVTRYGDPLGPTIDWLRAQGRTWEQIIESASRTGGRDLGF